jgi:hypothetical protein
LREKFDGITELTELTEFLTGKHEEDEIHEGRQGKVLDRINKIYRIRGKDFDRRNTKDMKTGCESEALTELTKNPNSFSSRFHGFSSNPFCVLPLQFR